MKNRKIVISDIDKDLDSNITSYFQKILPLASSILLLLISYIPLDFSIFNNIRPAVVLVCVYFWMLHRPDLFNLFSVFLLGMTDDIISSAPMGSSIFEVLVMYLLINNLQRFFNGKPFAITWYGFAILSLLTMLSRWLVVSVYYSQFLPLSILMFSYLVTVAAYPVISLLFAFVQNTLIYDDEN